MIRLDVPRSRNQLYDDLRVALLRVLSPECKCAKCGGRQDVRQLEIDHIDARGWDARAMDSLRRVERYWSEFLAGVQLRALCRSCNAIDGARRQWNQRNWNRSAA